MKRFVLGHVDGAQSRVHISDDEMVLETYTPGKVNQAHLDHVARMRNQGHNARAKGRLAASIPSTLYEAWKKEWNRQYKDVWTWPTYLAMKLNSRDYSYLRTGGKL